MIKLKSQKAESMGMTLEQYEDSVKEARKQRGRSRSKGGLTDEGRKRMSESLKERWNDPDFRRKLSVNRNHTHSQDTRQKISMAIKKKWENEEYRARLTHSPNEDVRQKISATLKSRWQDPEFRANMSRSTSFRDADWNTKISDKIKEKWRDVNYRRNVVSGLRNVTLSDHYRNYDQINKKIQAEMTKEKSKSNIMSIVKRAVQNRKVNKSAIKSLLGSDVWVEEKV